VQDKICKGYQSSKRDSAQTEHSFGARGFRLAAPGIRNSLPSIVHSCETHNTLPTSEISSFYFNLCHCLATHLSAYDLFTTMALYKSIYLLTYLFNTDRIKRDKDVIDLIKTAKQLMKQVVKVI